MRTIEINQIGVGWCAAHLAYDRRELTTMTSSLRSLPLITTTGIRLRFSTGYRTLSGHSVLEELYKYARLRRFPRVS